MTHLIFLPQTSINASSRPPFSRFLAFLGGFSLFFWWFCSEAGSISVYNNGRGIPIEMHSKEKIWVPELIFGHLLTSSNYNDKEKKTTGGRNGYGAKLANIFSTEFIVETVRSRSRPPTSTSTSTSLSTYPTQQNSK